MTRATPSSGTTAPTAASSIQPEKVNATQLKFQNFDSELTQLISGLKSNLKKDADASLDDDKLLLVSAQDNDVEPLALTPTKTSNDEPILINESNEQPQQQQQIASTDGNSHQNINLNKPLADIVVDLNEIRPHDDYAPRCIMEEKSGGLKIMLNFTKDKPRADIAVLVITTTNHNSLPIRNFQFEASVTKVGNVLLDYFHVALLRKVCARFSFFHFLHMRPNNFLFVPAL